MNSSENLVEEFINRDSWNKCMRQDTITSIRSMGILKNSIIPNLHLLEELYMTSNSRRTLQWRMPGNSWKQRIQNWMNSFLVLTSSYHKWRNSWSISDFKSYRTWLSQLQQVDGRLHQTPYSCTRKEDWYMSLLSL